VVEELGIQVGRGAAGADESGFDAVGGGAGHEAEDEEGIFGHEVVVTQTCWHSHSWLCGLMRKSHGLEITKSFRSLGLFGCLTSGKEHSQEWLCHPKGRIKSKCCTVNKQYIQNYRYLIGILCCMAYYERNLPHWQPVGATFFVTWRLFGSLPLQKRAARNGCAKGDGDGEETPGERFVRLDGLLDRTAVGPHWLRIPSVADCVTALILKGERELGYFSLRAFVIMPNHVHLLIAPKIDLPRIMNPVAAGLVARAEEWPWSSAANVGRGK
jgi:hypothetical protein